MGDGKPLVETDADLLPVDPADLDSQFRALMAGLRTTIPGILVLFSFLLVLPLQSRFEDADRVIRTAFYIAFFSSTTSALLFIAPSVHQRVRAPMTGIMRTNPHHVMTAVRLTILGTIFFAIAIVSVVFLVSTILFPEFWAGVAAALIAAAAGWAWFYLPMVRFRKITD